VKDDLRSDLRYRAVKRDDREKAFDAYIAELRAAEQEVEHAGKSKKDEEEKLRGKEREQRKRKDREEEELERVRLKARHKDAVTAYQALLKEKIKDPETLDQSWRGMDLAVLQIQTWTSLNVKNCSRSM
jgi:transcription elongation regulator 1